VPGRAAHLEQWELPPGWRWGEGGLFTPYRHAQQIYDAFGRALALVTAPDPGHHDWLFAEARALAHRNHPSIPTTFHYWVQAPGARRGPGYLRRWIVGETVEQRLKRVGTGTVPDALRVLRGAGSALAYLHDSGMSHGAIAPQTVYVTPTGRLWLLGWQWAVHGRTMPDGIRPDPRWFPGPAEWAGDRWAPTPPSDQWQLGAVCFAMLTGELPPREEIPPVRWVRPDCPASVAEILDRALQPDPADRFPNLPALLRQIERISGTGAPTVVGVDDGSGEYRAMNEEGRLRWATGDDYEVLAHLGAGTFGSVWRVRDLSLEREVALKMLHPHVARSEAAVARFQREARLAAQLQHPAIVPIYDWDAKGDVQWYIMELQEEGSVAELVARQGARTLEEIAPEIEGVLDGLEVAHANGVIHRDLKPENVLIDRYGRWRMTDFGIAQAIGDERGGTTGTPAFAPPEQLLGEPQGVTGDLFAVAAIVVFALTGRPPFEGTDGRAILAQQLAGKVDLTPFDEPLARWIARALHAQPEERFPDAAAMKAAWQDLVTELVQEPGAAGLLRRAREVLRRALG